MPIVEWLEERVLLSRSWFVATSGNDHNPGTLAQPFATIQHAANLAGPGDFVYIRGGTYHEQVTPAHSGTAVAPITYSAYNNETVTISGADRVSGWTLNGGKVYRAPQSWNLGDGNNQVFVDGKMVNEARWPNTGSDLLHPALATIASAFTTSPSDGWLVSATATIADPALPNLDWSGATIHFGAGQNWVVQSGTVLSSSAGKLLIAFQHYTHYEIPTVGNHFYLTGSFKMLDAAGEWYRDPNTGLLYLWTPAGDSPALHDVEVKRRAVAIELAGRSYIHVSGINVFAATIDTNAASNHLVLSKLSAKYVWNQNVIPDPWDRHNRDGHSGIILNGTNNVLMNSTIAFSSGNGVWVGGANNTVQNCVIHDIDYAAVDEAGITDSGSNQQIIGNTIYNTGRDGILASSETGGRIDSNTIYNIGTLTTDLGGIYTHGNIAHGTEIAFNKISNVHTGGFGGGGVYLDNGSSGYVVHDNVLSNIDHPIKVNPPAYGNSIYNNTISFGGQTAQPTFGPKSWSNASTTFTLLGSLGGYRSQASAINASGLIVGSSSAGGSTPAVFSTGGALTSIGSLGGIQAAASAVNAAGQIVGESTDATGTRHAFLYSGGRMINLGQLPGDLASLAAGIDSTGQIVGVSYGQNAIGHALLYSNGKMTPLGTLGGRISQAMAINDAGTIVGDSTVAGDANAHAFMYAARQMHDLGTLGGGSSYALAINSGGAIVGQSLIKGDSAFHAFLYSAGKMQDLSVLPGFTNSIATAINDQGDIVGYCTSSTYLTVHAFLYRDGKMTDLNTLVPANTGWTLTSAAGININDKIVGTAQDKDGNQRAYLLSVVG